MFHILIVLATDGGLRVMMKLRGFKRLRVGPIYISYYYHPGTGRSDNDKHQMYENNGEDEEIDRVPIVFCQCV